MKKLLFLNFLISIIFAFRPYCKPGFKYCFKTHQCIRKPCNIRCAKGYFLTKDCRCEKNQTFCIALACPPGYIRKPPSCKCVKKSPPKPPLPPPPVPPKNCKISKCRTGYKINKNCKCVPKSLFVCYKLCPPRQHIRPGSCVCVPKRSCQILTCKNGYKLDYGNCRCVKKTPPPPPPPKNCKISSCYAGYRVNGNCACEPVGPPVCRIFCRKGTTLRPGKCVCDPIRKCQIRRCKFGNRLDYGKCKCVKKTPPKPFEPCNIKSCDYRYEVSPNKCACRVKRGPTCRKGCPRGLRIFPGRCKCVKPPSCPITSCKEGYHLNKRQCKCSKRSEPPVLPPKPCPYDPYWGGYGYDDYYGGYDDYYREPAYPSYTRENNSNVLIGASYK